MAKLTDSKEWFGIWHADKQSMVCTMIKNLSADLEAGYDPLGNCIRNQRAEIDRYTIQFENEMDAFKSMDEKSVNRWCFYDMKKRGVIE